jgi:transketolase
MEKQKQMYDFRVLAAEIRLQTLKIIVSRGFGHVSGSMSMADAMAVLYGAVMKIDSKNPRAKDRDWFVLSKGHGGPVMYATLGLMGYYPLEEAYTLNQPNTNFPSHTDRNKTVGVDLTTGSLGQGMSEAVGAALGCKVQGGSNRVYVAVGDGECDEGQIWEAAQFAAHYKLDNLVCLVDDNKRQLDGPVSEVMSHGLGLGEKFCAFGWHVITLEDGNDVEVIYDALMKAQTIKGCPTAIILNTVKGKGATFAEPTGAHSSQPSKAEWDEAIAASEKALSALRAQGKGGR